MRYIAYARWIDTENDKRDVYRWWSKHGLVVHLHDGELTQFFSFIIWTQRGRRNALLFRSLAVSRINRFCWSRWNWIKNLDVKRNQYLQFHTSYRKGKRSIWLSGRDYTVACRITCLSYILIVISLSDEILRKKQKYEKKTLRKKNFSIVPLLMISRKGNWDNFFFFFFLCLVKLQLFLRGNDYLQ